MNIDIQYRDNTNDKSKEENNTAPFLLLLGFDILFYLVFIWNYLNGNFGGDFLGQSEKPVAILAPVFSTMHTIWIV